MEREWSLDLYQDTVTLSGVYEPPDRDDLPDISQQIQAITDGIIRRPYSVAHWLARSSLLLQLGYPELAVGDSYKARLLIQAVKDTSELGKKAVLAYRTLLTTNRSKTIPLKTLRSSIVNLYDQKSWIVLVRSLLLARAAADSLDICREGLSVYPDDPDLQWWLEVLEEHVDLKEKHVPPEDRTESWATDVRNGGVHMRAYPWMTTDELQRSDSLIEKMNVEFLATSDGKCTVARTMFEGSDERTDELGVFAARDIPAEDTVMIDFTPISATNDPDSCPTCSVNLENRPLDLQLAFPAQPRNIPCCNERYCSPRCAELGLETFHPPICGRDLSFLLPICAPEGSDSASEFHLNPWATVSRLLLRCIASAIQADTHPLQTPLLSHFKATYAGSHVLIFNLSNITDSFKMLQALGIDIFADLRFDTWVLHSVQCRIANNKSGRDTDKGYEYTHVNPLYSMLNHDCDPNTLQPPQFDPCSVEFIVAKRDIKKGEQIFTTYLAQQDLDLPWEARQQELFRWIRGECRCKRCILETKDN